MGTPMPRSPAAAPAQSVLGRKAVEAAVHRAAGHSGETLDLASKRPGLRTLRRTPWGASAELASR